MSKYICVRDCHYAGRVWKEDEVVDFQETPPHHFKLVDEGVAVTTEMHKSTHDPMKPVMGNQANTFSGMAAQSNPIKTGMATGLDVQSNLSPKDLKKVKKSRSTNEEE